MTFVALSAVPGDDIYPLNGATVLWESRAGRGGERRGQDSRHTGTRAGQMATALGLADTLLDVF